MVISFKYISCKFNTSSNSKLRASHFIGNSFKYVRVFCILKSVLNHKVCG